MKILLTCPECGNSEWLEEPDEDGAFECGACGDHVFPEDMGSALSKDGKTIDMD